MNLFRRLLPSFEDRVNKALKSVGAEYSVTYDPAFPKKDGTSFSWFQVIYGIPASDDASAREAAHILIGQTIKIASRFRKVRHADTVSVRIRRYDISASNPDYPIMYIEAAFDRSAISALCKSGDFQTWHSGAYSYVNRLDRSDPLNKLRNTEQGA